MWRRPCQCAMDFVRRRAVKGDQAGPIMRLCHTPCSVRTSADLLEATEGFRSVSMAAAAPTAAATAASVELPSPLVLVCMTYKRNQRTSMPVFSVSLNGFAPPCMFARSTVPIRQVMNSSPCAMIPLYVCILSIFLNLWPLLQKMVGKGSGVTDLCGRHPVQAAGATLLAMQQAQICAIPALPF